MPFPNVIIRSQRHADGWGHCVAALVPWISRQSSGRRVAMARLAILLLAGMVCLGMIGGIACTGGKTVHVIATLEVQVVDNRTKEPLPNVTVFFTPSKVIGVDFNDIEHTTGKTGADGVATFTVECDLGEGEKTESLRLWASHVNFKDSGSSVFINFEDAKEAADGGNAVMTRSVKLEK